MRKRTPEYKAAQAARERARYAADPEAKLAKNRAHYAANADELKAKNAARRRERYAGRYAQQERARHLMTKYGITLEQYDAMLTEQGGVCAGCGAEPTAISLHVDHDHTTGAVRGLLCFPCNAALGNAGDSAERLLSLAAYLVRSENVLESVGGA